eukprot:scaffold287165_cov44-Prasinocladus_malaysianus.AAC.2
MAGTFNVETVSPARVGRCSVLSCDLSTGSPSLKLQNPSLQTSDTSIPISAAVEIFLAANSAPSPTCRLSLLTPDDRVVRKSTSNSARGIARVAATAGRAEVDTDEVSFRLDRAPDCEDPEATTRKDTISLQPALLLRGAVPAENRPEKLAAISYGYTGPVPDAAETRAEKNSARLRSSSAQETENLAPDSSASTTRPEELARKLLRA